MDYYWICGLLIIVFLIVYTQISTKKEELEKELKEQKKKTRTLNREKNIEFLSSFYNLSMVDATILLDDMEKWDCADDFFEANNDADRQNAMDRAIDIIEEQRRRNPMMYDIAVEDERRKTLEWRYRQQEQQKNVEKENQKDQGTFV